jgi:hypothetical protein
VGQLSKSRRGSEAQPIEGAPAPSLPVLWQATLHISGGGSQTFLFRHGSDVTAATVEAQKLLEKSHAPAAAASEIVGVERVGRLWN